jgi:hypothetical protein
MQISLKSELNVEKKIAAIEGLNKKFPLNPKNPERICWGCDRYCAIDSLACGNGADRTPHPCELFGEDWLSWGANKAIDV